MPLLQIFPLPPVLSLPAHLCLPSPPGFGGQPETVQRALPRLDAPRPIKHQKRGTEAPPNPGFGLLIRYEDLTPQTLPPNHPQG